MAMQFKKALVTGGAGFIGSHIAEKLLECGIETVVLDDLSVGHRRNVPERAHLMIGDVCDAKAVCEALADVDIVFHLAARVSIRDSFRGFTEDVRTNVMGTVNLLKCMEGSKAKKLIYSSSMATYGDAKYLPIDEKHPLEPSSPYGISKLSSEKYVLCFSRHIGIDSVILRYFNTYGKRQTFTPYVGVITIFIQKLRGGEELPIFGDGTQIRDFVSVDDVAEANILAMGYRGPFRIFNIGTGTGTTIDSLAHILKGLMNKNCRIQYLPLQPGEPSSSVADITLAKTELGFTPRLKVEEKLRDVIEWNMKETDRE